MVTSHEIRQYADGDHFARIEQVLPPTLARHMGRDTDTRFPRCRPNRVGHRIWFPAPHADVIPIQMRWDNDSDYASYVRPLTEGTRCVICDP